MAYTEEERRLRALEAAARYRERNREKERARVAKYRAESPEKVAEYSAANKDKAAVNSARWRAAHPEKVKEVNARQDAKPHRKGRFTGLTPEQRATRVAAVIACRERNPERAAEVARASRQRNKERIHLAKQNRRARKLGQGSKISKGLIGKLLTLQRGKCAGCGVSLAEAGRHLDHNMPLARGGAHADHNMQLLCPPCNLKKNAKDPIEWAQSLGRLL